MRMGMRRFTRLTNAFTKKLENHMHAVSLHFMVYNFVKTHKTIKTTQRWKRALRPTCGMEHRDDNGRDGAIKNPPKRVNLAIVPANIIRYRRVFCSFDRLGNPCHQQIQPTL